MDNLQLQIIHDAAAKRDAAPHGMKKKVLASPAALLGLSVKRLETLIELHVGRKRKVRADKNKTAYDRQVLQFVSGVWCEGRRSNGSKAMWSLERVLDVLYADGKLETKLSQSRVSKLLRQHYLHPDQLLAPAPATSMSTPHPNYLVQMDFSVCVLYKNTRGEVELMGHEAFYRNKLHNFVKVINDLIVRCVATDHASGAVAVRFYLGGETTENALDFLMWLIVQRNGADGRGLPFYGVPFHLYTDQGSAFKSAPFVNFCEVLGIKLNHHKPRNARATGQVENAQNLVERGLEGTLRFLDRATVTIPVLNALADQWMNVFNGTRKHGRHGMTRYGAWSHITKEQLRTVSSVELLRELPASKPEVRTVSNNMLVSFAIKGFGSKQYCLRGVTGAAPEEKVLVSVNPFRAPVVNVGVTNTTTGEIEWQPVEPVEYDFYGFDRSAPRYGEEFRSMPNTIVDENRNAIARRAYATGDGPATLEQAASARRSKRAPYLGQFNPLADMEAARVPEYLPRAGTEMRRPSREIAPVMLNSFEICVRLRNRMGGGVYKPSTGAWVFENYPNGTSEDRLDDIEDQVRAFDASNAPPGAVQLPRLYRSAASGPSNQDLEEEQREFRELRKRGLAQIDEARKQASGDGF